jgi:hypothetical protein
MHRGGLWRAIFLLQSTRPESLTAERVLNSLQRIVVSKNLFRSFLSVGVSELPYVATTGICVFAKAITLPYSDSGRYFPGLKALVCALSL